MNKRRMKGSIGIILLIICLVAIIGMLGYIFFLGKPGKVTSLPTNSAQLQPTQTIPVKDFAPGMPAGQKTSILIQTDDSSDEKYIVPTNQVSVYVKSLPQGDHVISETAL